MGPLLHPIYIISHSHQKLQVLYLKIDTQIKAAELYILRPRYPFSYLRLFASGQAHFICLYTLYRPPSLTYNSRL